MPTTKPAVKKEDSRLARLTEICLALPETTRVTRDEHASFHVRNTTFAYYLANHHNDGIWSVCVKVLPGDNEMLVRMNPRLFYLPAYIGPRGWVAFRLDTEKENIKIDWEEVTSLVTGSYQLVAPKQLAGLIAES
jgi:predicted DNA-binding protein (MmcQ/YjbR family)